MKMFFLLSFAALIAVLLGHCPAKNSLNLGGVCYTFHPDLTNFNEAERFCKLNGGHLASMDGNNARLSILITEYASSAFNGASHFWVNRSLSQYHGGSYEEANTCISAGIKLRKWKSESCLTQLPFVCEHRDSENSFFKKEQALPGNCPHQNRRFYAENPRKSSLPPYCAYPSAGPKYELFNGNCYAMVKQALAWRDAEDECVRQGGHLTSIHTPEENQFIISKFYIPPANYAWIGLRTIGVNWYWTDGTPFDCDYWETNQQPLGNRTSAMIKKSQWWQKQDPSQQKYFICKKRAI